jgi:hypothetical protein
MAALIFLMGRSRIRSECPVPAIGANKRAGFKSLGPSSDLFVQGKFAPRYLRQAVKILRWLFGFLLLFCHLAGAS